MENIFYTFDKKNATSMNKIGITLLMFFNFYNVTFSQVKDTIFYNKYWNASTKAQAHFFRPLPLEVKGDLFVIKDYYINGNLQMKAYSKDKSGKPFEKKAIWFYENGTKMIERTYDNGNLIGKDNSYFHNGTPMTSADYKDGKCFEGTYYNSRKTEFKTTTVKQGETFSSNAYYETTKTIALKKLYKQDHSKPNLLFFNRVGDTLYKANERNYNIVYNNELTKVYYSLSEHNNINDIIFLLYQEDKNNELKQIIKDTNGKIIAEGVTKDTRPFNGQFLEKKKLITYTEGEKEGEVIFYDDDYNEVSKGVYKDGKEFSGDFYQSYSKEIKSYENGEVVAKKTTNKFTNEAYSCRFEGYKPIEGNVFDYNTVKSYKAGKLMQSVIFDSNSGVKKSVMYYNPEAQYQQIAKKVFYEDGKENIVTYKDGVAYNGKEINNYGFITHKNGKVNGPFLIKDKKVDVYGNYTDYKKDGLIHYNLKNKEKDTYTCTYRVGKPVDGTTFEYYNLTHYKNGKKEGCGYKTFNNRRYPYDSLQICYKEDNPVGTSAYYFKNRLIGNITYKEGKPFDGVFYDNENKKVYKKGQITEQRISLLKKYSKIQFLNTNNQITKEVVKDYHSDTIIYTTSFKNGFPYQGTHVALDSLKKFLIETNYLKGKKEGKQTYSDAYRTQFLKSYTYKNDIRDGVAEFKDNFSDSTYQSIYKKGKAFSGIFIEQNKLFIGKASIRKGVTDSISYYDVYRNKKIGAIDFSNRKPFNGMLFKLVDDKHKEVEKYTEGKLKVSYLKPSDFSKSGEPNYYSSKTFYQALKDSVITSSSFREKGRLSSYSINYSDVDKQSGDVTYYEQDTIIGKGTFKKNILTSFNLKNKEIGYVENTINLIDGTLLYESNVDSFKAKFYSKHLKFEDSRFYFGGISKMQSNNKGDLELYLDSELPLSIVKIQGGKPYEGLMFYPENKKDKYVLFLLEKGSRKERFYALSKEELIQKIEELKLN